MRFVVPTLLLPLFVACDVEYDVPSEPPDAGEHYTVPEAWRLVREEMVKAKACFAERRPYCLTDRDILDDAIQLDLDTHFHGRMPLNERWLEELTGRSRAHWNDAMRSRHRSKVAQRIATNWEQPNRERRKGRVDVDLFVPPGELSVEKNSWRIQTELVSAQELLSSELAKQLDIYRAQYPNMPVVRLLIDVPVQGGLGFRRWDVRHQLTSDRVVVVDPLDPVGAWVSPPIGPQGFAPYIEGMESFATKDLERCALGDTMAAAPDCSVHPPYNPTKKRRQPVKDRGVPRPGWVPQGEGEGFGKSKKTKKD